MLSPARLARKGRFHFSALRDSRVTAGSCFRYHPKYHPAESPARITPRRGSALGERRGLSTLIFDRTDSANVSIPRFWRGRSGRQTARFLPREEGCGAAVAQLVADWPFSKLHAPSTIAGMAAPGTRRTTARSFVLTARSFAVNLRRFAADARSFPPNPQSFAPNPQSSGIALRAVGTDPRKFVPRLRACRMAGRGFGPNDRRGGAQPRSFRVNARAVAPSFRADTADDRAATGSASVRFTSSSASRPAGPLSLSVKHKPKPNHP